MKISVISYSLSEQPAGLFDWESKLITEIDSLLASGSKVILYPELFLMGLSDYFPGELKTQFQLISDYTKKTLLPLLTKKLKGKDLLLNLGSGPRMDNGKIFNTSFIWVNESWIFQDKIHLTPWEVDFTPGSEVKFFSFHKLNCASVICFDIEQPGLGLMLKRSGVDLILCPSATTNKNGNQRVNRCASARSVELGAAVIVSPLVGDSRCDLVDHNEGRQGFFLPAQEAVIVEQEQFSEYSVKNHVIHHFELEVEMMVELKKKTEETKPYFKEDLILP